MDEHGKTLGQATRELSIAVDKLYNTIANEHPIIRLFLWVLSRPKRQFLLIWAILCSLVLLITLIAK